MGASLGRSMIVKDHEPTASSDRLHRAGDAAEKQMAFYLRRAFGDDPNAHVFHGLRLTRGEDVAQIDHLVLHRSGAVIVESKSVTTAVRINERDEWARQWNGRWTGMPSPVLQAGRQADVLRALLQDHKEELLGKVLFGMRQKSFRAFVIDVLVAVSDGGVVEARGTLPEVCKADQVADRVKALVADHVRLAHPLSRDPRSDKWGVTITSEEFVRVSAFLRARHTPRRPSAAPEAIAVGSPESREASRPTAVAPRPVSDRVSVRCRRCASEAVSVAYGKYGYYLKCGECDGNTPIPMDCPKCGAKGRIRKAGEEFFRECGACGSSALYHRNGPPPV